MRPRAIPRDTTSKEPTGPANSAFATALTRIAFVVPSALSVQTSDAQRCASSHAGTRESEAPLSPSSACCAAAMASTRSSRRATAALSFGGRCLIMSQISAWSNPRSVNRRSHLRPRCSSWQIGSSAVAEMNGTEEDSREEPPQGDAAKLPELGPRSGALSMSCPLPPMCGLEDWGMPARGNPPMYEGEAVRVPARGNSGCASGFNSISCAGSVNPVDCIAGMAHALVTGAPCTEPKGMGNEAWSETVLADPPGEIIGWDPLGESTSCSDEDSEDPTDCIAGMAHALVSGARCAEPRGVRNEVWSETVLADPPGEITGWDPPGESTGFSSSSLAPACPF
eukprot:3935285-Rhodomonas_salina.2